MPALWLSAIPASLLEAGGTGLVETRRHGTACEGRRQHGGPRAGPVELINCFCSALGVSFNIHQPVMKESSELLLNIDGPGRLTTGLGRLPPAHAAPRPRRDSQLAKIRLAFPGKPPCARQGGQAPRRQRGKEDSCLLTACGGTHAARQPPGKVRAAPGAEGCGGWPGHLEKGRQVRASLQRCTTAPDTNVHPPCTRLHSWQLPSILLSPSQTR